MLTTLYVRVLFAVRCSQRTLWGLMVSESARLAAVDGIVVPGSVVTREGYVAMHIRVSKALDANFDVGESNNSANGDWAEDITAFSGDSHVKDHHHDQPRCDVDR